MVRASLCSGELPAARELAALQALQAEQFGGTRAELKDAVKVTLHGLKALFDAVRRAELAARNVKAAAGNGEDGREDESDDDGSGSSASEGFEDDSARARSASRKRRRPIGSGRLEELPVEGFDAEQLWAMLDMENKPTMRYLEEAVADLEEASKRDGDLRLLAAPSDDEDEDDDEDGEEDDDDDEEEEDGDEEEDEDEDEDEEADSDLEAMLARARKRKEAAKTKLQDDDEDEDEEKDEDDEEEVDEEEKDDAEDLDVPTEMDDDFFTFADMERFTSSVEDDDVKMKLQLLKQEKKQKESDAKEARKGVGRDEEDDYSDDGAGEDDLDEDDEEEDDNDSGIDLDMANDDDEDGDEDDKARHATFADFWGRGARPKSAKTKLAGKSNPKKKLADADAEEDEDEEDEDGLESESAAEEEEEDVEMGSEAEDEAANDVDEEAADVRLSTHEKQQLALREQIKELEDELVGEKAWEYTGETKGRNRPKNALLEKGADLDVDFIARPAPAITEEVTKSLEDRIRQRILDNDYDDVERKLPMEKDADYRPKAELSMEKSKTGLGDEYAAAYEQQVLGHTAEADAARTEAQEELHTMFTALCHKLDSLSNYHYTPKPPTLEGSVQAKNTAAIEMEEAMPVAVSASAQAAPEQVLAARKGREGVGKTREEMDQEERRTLRQAKKTAKRKRQRQRDAEKRIVSKLNPGLGNKHAKRAAAITASGGAAAGATGGDDTKWTKSSTFFAKMQQNDADDRAGLKRKGRDDSKTRGASSAAQMRL